jgi:hypothetical protein
LFSHDIIIYPSSLSFTYMEVHEHLCLGGESIWLLEFVFGINFFFRGENGVHSLGCGGLLNTCLSKCLVFLGCLIMVLIFWRM